MEFWRAKIRATWALACEWQGVDPRDKFVEFREDNPHLPANRQAWEEFFHARAVLVRVQNVERMQQMWGRKKKARS